MSQGCTICFHYHFVVLVKQIRQSCNVSKPTFESFAANIIPPLKYEIQYFFIILSPSTVYQEENKQKVITQAHDYRRVKGYTLKVQNCDKRKSSTLGFLRSLRSPRSNNLETKNNKNFLVKTYENQMKPKIWPQRPRKCPLDLNDLGRGWVNFSKNYIFKISESS